MGDVFKIINALVAKIAHQAACEAGQAGDVGCFELRVVLRDDVQRIAIVRLDKLMILVDFGAIARYFDVVAAGQPDKGIPPKAFATHHRFQQIAKRLVGEFQIQRQRCV